MNDDRILWLDAHLGAPITARLVDASVPHPLRRELTCPAGDLHVEFYDRRFAREPGYRPHGQFIVRQCASTLLAHPPGKLILNSRVPQWFVDESGVLQLKEWLATRQAHASARAAASPGPDASAANTALVSSAR